VKTLPDDLKMKYSICGLRFVVFEHRVLPVSQDLPEPQFPVYDESGVAFMDKPRFRIMIPDAAPFCTLLSDL
jgi:hypothetical protein